MSEVHGRRRQWLTAALLLLPLAGACDEDGTMPPVGEDALLSVYLKDAPGDVDSVWVQIDDVLLAGDGGQVSVLAEPTGLVNLTALQDSATPLVEDLVLDSASYREVRLILGGAVLQTTDGTVYSMGGAEHPHGLPATGELMCPSCSRSGLKVKLAGDLEVASGSNGLLLDFDVSQSFGHQAGKSGKWVMHPVIHGAAGEPDDMEDGESPGTISGTVVLGVDENGDTVAIPACGDTTVTRTLAWFVPTATSTTLTDDEGAFLTFAGTTESEDDGFTFEIDVADFDTYALSHTTETEFDGGKLVWAATAAPDMATVAEGAGHVGDVVYTVTSVTCAPLTP